MVERSKDCLCFTCSQPGKGVCAFKPLFAVSGVFDVTVLVTKCKKFKAKEDGD